MLKIIRQYMKDGQRVFVGVVAPIDPRVETPGGGARPRAGGGGVHPRRAARHHRRLRLLALQRRRLHDARQGLREDPRPRRGHGPGREGLEGGDEPGDREDELLQSVALQNATSILRAPAGGAELLEAKEALRQSNEMLRAIFEQAAIGSRSPTSTAAPRRQPVLRDPRLPDGGLQAVVLAYPRADHAETAASFRRLLAGEIRDYSIEKRYVRGDGSHLVPGHGHAAPRPVRRASAASGHRGHHRPPGHRGGLQDETRISSC